MAALLRTGPLTVEFVVGARQVIAGRGASIIVILPCVCVPTLVLHCRGDAAVPFEEGRVMAAGIAGSRFVELEARNHTILEGDPARQRFLDEMRGFLAS